MNITDWFGSLDLAIKYVVVFGALIVLALIFGIIKVIYNRRRLKKYGRIAPHSSATSSEDRENLAPHDRDEGALFGVRAIEAGFYGGVPQSSRTSLISTARTSIAGASRSSSPHRYMQQRKSAPLLATASSSMVDLNAAGRNSINVTRTTEVTHYRLNTADSDSALHSTQMLARQSVSSGKLRVEEGGRGLLRPSTAQIFGRHSHEPVFASLDPRSSSPEDESDSVSRTNSNESSSPLEGTRQGHKSHHSGTLNRLMGSLPELQVEEVPNHAEEAERHAQSDLAQPPSPDTPRKEKFLRGSIHSRTSSSGSIHTVRRVHSPPPPLPSDPLPMPKTPSPAISGGQINAKSSQNLARGSYAAESPTRATANPLVTRHSYYQYERVMADSPEPMTPIAPRMPEPAVQSPPPLPEFIEPSDEQLAMRKSMPLLGRNESAFDVRARNAGHLSVDILNEKLIQTSYDYTLPEIRPRSPLRMSLAMTNSTRHSMQTIKIPKSNRESTQSGLDPSMNSHHTSFSYAPTLPEYHGYGNHDRRPPSFSAGPLASHPYKKTPPGTRRDRPQTEGYFAALSAKLVTNRSSRRLSKQQQVSQV